MASWYDLMVDEEEHKTDAYVRMTESEWKTEAQRIIRSWTGDLRACINHLDDMDARRKAEAPETTAQPVAPLTEDERTWRVWKDMVEEPWKYGSDIGEWLEIDQTVRTGPKRWRAAAVWWEAVRELEQQESTAAAKIQALWRGHIAREVVAPRFNCARCLAHAPCPTEWDAAEWICSACSTEWSTLLKVNGFELETEETCGDCGDEMVYTGAQIGDLTLCPACVHDWTTCTRCDGAIRYGTRCDNHCIGCDDTLSDTCLSAFCSSDCRTDYLRDCHRGMD
jgi:hypothetical protein